MALAQEHHPALVLLDGRLSGSDGSELARRLQSDEAIKDIPIIALSGHTGDGYRETMREAGVKTYVTKPYRIAKHGCRGDQR